MSRWQREPVPHASVWHPPADGFLAVAYLHPKLCRACSVCPAFWQGRGLWEKRSAQQTGQGVADYQTAQGAVPHPAAAMQALPEAFAVHSLISMPGRLVRIADTQG